MGGLISKVSFTWKGWRSGMSNSEEVQAPYKEFVREIMEAVKKGNCERLKQLQEESGMMLWGGIESVDTSPSIIQSAAAHGHEDIVKYILDLGVDADQADTCGMSALHEACKGGQVGCVRLLANKSQNIDMRDVWGRTPLIKALVYRNTEAAMLLLERGANPNAVDIYGITPLSTAIDYNMVDMLKILVFHGADVNLVTQHMYKCSGPPLYQAINNQNLMMVNELIQLGVNTEPRSQDYNGSFRGGMATSAWHYLSGTVSLYPALSHSNAVIMAMSELAKRGHTVDVSGPVMEILMALLAAHGHLLDSYPDVLIRVLINSHAKDFSVLLHKLQMCSSNSQDNLLASSSGRDSNQRPHTRPQHLQQMDNHLRGGNGGRHTPRVVMSLQNQARRVARQAMMASGRNVVWAAKRLQCPPALKSLLQLKDIDRAFSPPLLKTKSLMVV